MGSIEESPKSFDDWPNHQGFTSTYEEREPVELSVTGNIPAWAAGVLFRTGIGPRETLTKSGDVYRVAHWFDAWAVVHRFQILAPDEDHTSVRVIYNSRSVCDGLIDKVRQTGRRELISFAATYEPCKSYFQKVMSFFNPAPQSKPDEKNVGVTISVNFPGLDSTGQKKQGGHASGIQTLCNKTDANNLQLLDPETLEPIGLATQEKLHPDLTGPLSAAHAKSDPVTGDVFNYNLQLGRSATYRIFHVSAATGKTSILATIRKADAAYIHSLFFSGNYVILCVWNSFYALGGIKILYKRNIADAIADYDPSRPARWYVVDKRPASEGGQGLVATYESEAFYSFHTINAYEEPSTSGNGVDIVADVITYNNLDTIKRFYLENVISNLPSASVSDPDSRGTIKRFRLASIINTATKAKGTRAATTEFTVDSVRGAELPIINPRCVAKPHRYVYAVVDTGKSTFLDGLIKHDLQTQETKTWSQQGQNAGEPIFIPRRHDDGSTVDTADEDDGVLLSVVLDGLEGRSYLLVLDAKTMTEVGRAAVSGPIGFGFHGTHVSSYGSKGIGGPDGRGLDI